jgi:hypothetical protein
MNGWQTAVIVGALFVFLIGFLALYLGKGQQ